jgi:hypothetical protein
MIIAPREEAGREGSRRIAPPNSDPAAIPAASRLTNLAWLSRLSQPNGIERPGPSATRLGSSRVRAGDAPIGCETSALPVNRVGTDVAAYASEEGFGLGAADGDHCTRGRCTGGGITPALRLCQPATRSGAS